MVDGDTDLSMGDEDDQTGAGQPLELLQAPGEQVVEEDIPGLALLEVSNQVFRDVWATMTDEAKNLMPIAIRLACIRRWVALPEAEPELPPPKGNGADVLQTRAGDLPPGEPIPIEGAKAAPAKKPELPLAPLDWPDLAARGDPPARKWAIYGWLGFFINLLVGSGGIGKTLLAQQLGSALALGRTFIDEIERPLTVLAWFCEDEHDEIWRRQVAIAKWLDVPLTDFEERLIIMPRQGKENALVSTEFGRPMFTPLIAELSEQASDYSADVVMLDNVAQLYGGGENDRHSVTFFMNGLAGALQGRAVLLLAHPARSQGSEFSGSSAWENVARNRLYLGTNLPDQKPPDQDEQLDANIRYLARRKANYSSKDYRRFEYQSGVLVPEAIDLITAGQSFGIVGGIYNQAAERTVLEGLKRLRDMGLNPSEGSTTARYLPRMLLEYKLSDGRTKSELSSAMRRLMTDGRLVKSVVGQYANNRAPMYGLVAVDQQKDQE